MNVYKTVEVPAIEATTKEVFQKTICDICKEDAEPVGWDVGEVEITMREGTSYPECGFGTNIEVHLCVECFKEKLVPFLESEGAVVNTEEWDWEITGGQLRPP